MAAGARLRQADPASADSEGSVGTSEATADPVVGTGAAKACNCGGLGGPVDGLAGSLGFFLFD